MADKIKNMSEQLILENVIRDSPVMEYGVSGSKIWVKREDLCVDEAKFSKLRGVLAHLSKRPEPVIGVLDSYHSHGGWGVSYLCQMLGKQVILFYPEIKGEPALREGQVNAVRLGAELYPMIPFKSVVLWYRARTILKEAFGDQGYMMPNGLQLDETIEETCEQVKKVDPKFFTGTVWVVSISTGTICQGVVKGLSEMGAEVMVLGHLGYSRKIEPLRKKIESGLINSKLSVQYIDEGYSYRDAVAFEVPFPCNKYYDLKAWKYLCENVHDFDGLDILFWNIGE